MNYKFIISTGDVDRHKSVLNPDGWELKNYNRNPVVFYNDLQSSPFIAPDPDYVIGHSKVWISNGILYARLFFDDLKNNPLAKKLKDKIDGGSIRAASVIFNPLTPSIKKNGITYYNKMELLGWKVVNIPSNPKCLLQSNNESNVSSKSIRQMKLKLLQSQL